jgi:hypothetical protein
MSKFISALFACFDFLSVYFLLVLAYTLLFFIILRPKATEWSPWRVVMMLLLVTVGEWSLVPLGSEDSSHSYSIADERTQEDFSKLLSALFFVSFVVASGMLLFNVVAGNLEERWHQEETKKKIRREKDEKPIAWLWLFAYLSYYHGVHFLCGLCSSTAAGAASSSSSSSAGAATSSTTFASRWLDVCRCYQRHILINRLRDEAVLQSIYDSHSESDGSRSNSCMCDITAACVPYRQAKIPELLLSEMCRAARVMAQEKSRDEVVEELRCALSLLNRPLKKTDHTSLEAWKTERETKLTKLEAFRKKERIRMEYLHKCEMDEWRRNISIRMEYLHKRGLLFGKEEEKEEEKEEKKEEEKTEEEKKEEEEENRAITPRTKERRLSLLPQVVEQL